MKIDEHIGKAARIERSAFGKLNRDSDYEIFVEGCMLAGTHLLNAVLHGSSITREEDDLLHSDKPPLSTPVSPEIADMMQKLKQIEDLRTGYLRGKVPWQMSHGDLCTRNMASLRASTDLLLIKKGSDR
jgi:hypothetical protein